jgi:aminotransferase
MSLCERPLSRIVEALPRSGIRRFFDLVSGMEDVIALGVGEPDFPTPWGISSSCVYGLERGRTSYTSNYGLIELRRGIARHLAATYGVEYDPETEILVTVGVSEALDLALRALLNPGDEVIIPQPCYVSYVPCVVMASGQPVTIPTTATTGFAVDPQEVEARVSRRTKALLIGYPNNPTGAVLSPAALRGLAEVAERHDLFVISDEIYDQLRYGSPHVCFASLPGMRDRTLLLNGFSKAYAMTGWRVGYAAAPARVVDLMVKIHQYTMLCAPITGQMAAIEALRRGQKYTAAMVAEYDRRRRVMVAGFNRIGLECLEPQGAFYTFPSIRATGLSSEEFCERLLHEERVAVVPGNAFGECGEGHVRATYANSLENIREALNRIERFVRGLRR